MSRMYNAQMLKLTDIQTVYYVGCFRLNRTSVCSGYASDHHLSIPAKTACIEQQSSSAGATT